MRWLFVKAAGNDVGLLSQLNSLAQVAWASFSSSFLLLLGVFTLTFTCHIELFDAVEMANYRRMSFIA